MQKKHTGFVAPALCNVIGILMILAVLAITVPLVLPGMFGYISYNVESGSMEPEIPVGSIVYVHNIAPQDIRTGEIIAFYKGETVVTHRVRENRIVEGEYITKGDANSIEDIENVPYAALIGRVEYHYPVLGDVMKLVTTGLGRIYLLLFAACGVMFNILAGRMRYNRRRKIREARKEAARKADNERYKEAQLKAMRERTGQADPAENAGETPQGAVLNSGGKQPAAKPKRSHRVRTVLMILLLVIFLGSAAGVGLVLWQYHVSDEIYLKAAGTYAGVRQTAQEELQADGILQELLNGSAAQPKTAKKRPRIIAPITVDFEGLQAVNEDVKGWIYCPDTVINYPLLYGENDFSYLRHTYEKEYNIAGSIFIESENDPDFADYNTVIYGHHMNDGSMFAGLDQWQEQQYYDKHPIMWLLTPKQDYMVVLASGHTTSAFSDSYLMIREPGEELTDYILAFLEQSDFETDLMLPLDGHYVVLSTCAYVFDHARYVLHGLLVPVDSAGGVAKEVEANE